MLFYTIYLVFSSWFMQTYEALDTIEKLTVFALIFLPFFSRTFLNLILLLKEKSLLLPKPEDEALKMKNIIE